MSGTDSCSTEAQRNATIFFSMLVRSVLSTKKVMCEHHLSSEAFHWIIGEIETRFNQAMAHPGEMVGALAAQSLGETGGTVVC